MRILFLVADRGIRFDRHNGASVYLRGMAAAMRQLGHDVELVTASAAGGEDLGVRITELGTPASLAWLLERTPPDDGPHAGDEPRRRRRVVHSLGHVWNNLEVERALEEAVALLRPDLVLERYSPFGIAGGAVSRTHGLRHVLDVHAPLASEGATYRAEALQEASWLLEDAAFAAASRIVAISAELRSILVGRGVPAEKIAVVPGGVDPQPYAAARQGRRFERDRVVVGFSGSLKPWHGIEIMLSAFEALVPDPRYEFLIVGDGQERAKIDGFSARHPGRLVATGSLPPREVPDVIGRMDIGLAPYPALDGFYFSPLKILEYMAAGCIAVASNIGQIPNMIEQDRTGALVSAGDAAALAREIARLADDPDRRRRMSGQAIRTVRDHWTWKKRVREMLGAACGD